MLLGHGLGGTKECGLWPIAKDVTADGWAGLAFDYRGFGDSDDAIGRPTKFFEVRHLTEDFLAAAAFARAHESLDSTRVVIYGFSMGAQAAAFATLKLQEQGAPVQGLIMVAPRVLPKPVKRGLIGGVMGASIVRICYCAVKMFAGLFQSGVQVVQHMPSKDHVHNVMPFSWCSWPIIPYGHSNEIAIESLLPFIIPAGEVWSLNKRLKTIEVPVQLVFGLHDEIGTAPAAVRLLFEAKLGKPVEVLELPCEHMSPLPMVNPEAYAKDKETYTDPADTYSPKIYPEQVLPVLRAFLAKGDQFP
jgi:pimeloyl-ACP methyl ester carboxylesterase